MSSKSEFSIDKLCAAIDLGSNSFHLLLARSTPIGFRPVERIKFKVQLLSGFDNGLLQEGAMVRGWDCLSRFSQRLVSLDRQDIWVMGTFALRKADNSTIFLQKAEEILGVKIQVISGEEEARIIFTGVAHQFPPTPKQDRLVFDIGGGSSELALGTGYEIKRQTSIELGCVSMTDQFFADPNLIATNFESAREFAESRLVNLRDEYQIGPGSEVIGTSGTVESTQMVLEANGWSGGGLTRHGIEEVAAAIVDRRWLVDAGLPGLAPDRTDIFPAGAAILGAAFRVFGWERLDFAEASLREGILYTKLDVEPSADVRADTIAELVKRFQVDTDQAERVERRALEFFDAIQATWLPDAIDSRNLLSWSSQLHEIGKHINTRHYHRYGFYVLRQVELRGFTAEQAKNLALMVRGHRRSFPGLSFGVLGGDLSHALTRVLALLRIAVICERAHINDYQTGDVVLTAETSHILHLRCSSNWLATHKLSQKELETEAEQLQRAGIQLNLT